MVTCGFAEENCSGVPHVKGPCLAIVQALQTGLPAMPATSLRMISIHKHMGSTLLPQDSVNHLIHRLL